MNHNSNKLVCASLFLTLGLSAFGQTIYDSYSSYNGNAFSMVNGQEIGNEISLSTNNFSLNGFTLEYYAPNPTLSPSVGLDVRFYYNDGPPTNSYATPGTLFFDSGWFYNTTLGGLPGNGFQVVTYSTSDLYSDSALNLPAGFQIPTDFTFTVTFTNLDSSNLINMPLANSPTNQFGITYGSYWRNDNGDWSLLTNSVPANFVASFTGVSVVPEPSVFYLGAIGSVLLLGVKKLRRKG